MDYKFLNEINSRPKLYSKYTAKELWTDEYRAQKMLEFHLNENIDVSSNKSSYIEASINFMVEKFNLDMDKSIIDFGCGPGLYTNKLAKLTKVTGIDFSKNSINYATKVASENNLDVKYILGDYLEINIDKKYDLIIMIMYDFCALSFNQRKNLLLKFKSILNEGGKIFFDILSHRAYEKIKETSFYEKNQLGGFWANDDYFVFVNTFKYEEDKVILDKYHIIDKDKSYDVYNWLKYYSLEELKSELAESGFSIDEVYSNMTGERYSEESDSIGVIASIYNL